MEWAGFLPIVGVLLLCALLLVFWPSVRRRALARHGSILDAELNLGTPQEEQWKPGFVRCTGDTLEWFPRHRLSLRPTQSLSRRASGIRAQTRTTDPMGLNGQRIVRLEPSSAMGTVVWELSLDTDALTALLAWLEAAPPSVGRFTA